MKYSVFITKFFSPDDDVVVTWDEFINVPFAAKTVRVVNIIVGTVIVNLTNVFKLHSSFQINSDRGCLAIFMPNSIGWAGGNKLTFTGEFRSGLINFNIQDYNIAYTFPEENNEGAQLNIGFCLEFED